MIDFDAFSVFYDTPLRISRTETTQGPMGAVEGDTSILFEGEVDLQQPSQSQLNRADAQGIDVDVIAYLPEPADVYQISDSVKVLEYVEQTAKDGTVETVALTIREGHVTGTIGLDNSLAIKWASS